MLTHAHVPVAVSHLAGALERPAMALVGASKRYQQTRALENVSFAIRPGEVVALVGPSGAGKSTVFRCLTRLVDVDVGYAEVLGRRLSELDSATLRATRRRIGLIFQQFNLVGRISALDNVLAGRLGHVSTLRVIVRRFPAEDRQIALAALDRVGLLDRAYQRADRLSGGQQQRVAIARVLAQQAKVILADEPVSSLDPRAAENVMTVLRDVARESRIAVLCALHQVEFAREFADRIVALRRGRLVLDVPATCFDGDAFSLVYGHAEANENPRAQDARETDVSGISIA